MEAKIGVWTPWAVILCCECHGPEFPKQTFDVESEEWQRFITPQELKEGNGLTHCDRCKEEIQLDEDIAKEHEVMFALLDKGIIAEMEQTGGMNHALTIPAESGTYYLTYNFDGDGLWWCSELDEEYAPLGEAFWIEEEELLDSIEELEGIQRK